MAEIRQYFSTGEVMALTKVTYRRIDRWCFREIIRASGRKALGKGRRRLFTFQDIVEIQTLKALTASGVRLSALRQCIAKLREDLATADNIERSFATVRLITDGKTVLKYVPERNHLESLDGFGQFAFAFGLGEEIKALRISAGELQRNSRYHRRAQARGERFEDGVQLGNIVSKK